MDRKKIVIMVMSGNRLMDFAGPADVFRHANHLRNIYDVLLVSPYTDILEGPAWLQINSLPYLETGIIDTLLITGTDTEADYKKFYTWLALAHNNIRRIGFVNVGNTILENCGLQLDRNFFHSRDGQLFTSGGVSSGIDLALAMVEEDCGRGVANNVASKLIFFYLSRQAYQIQFGNLVNSSALAIQLKEWLAGRLQEPLDVKRLAEHLNMSPREFHTGIYPANRHLPG